jgi:hypothetical protein
MPSFVKGGAAKTPFGKNEFLRSTRDLKFESYTCSAAVVAAETIDGSTQKILQTGEVIAKVTSTAEAGKVGPYDSNVGVTDGRNTVTNIVGINNTFLPWQLLEHDTEISVLYEGTVVKAWCYERNNGVRQALAAAAAVTAMSAGGTAPGVSIIFR